MATTKTTTRKPRTTKPTTDAEIRAAKDAGKVVNVTQRSTDCGSCENGECDDCGFYACCADSNPNLLEEIPAGCRCGCGESVGKRAKYRPGHDARHAGQVARAAAAKPDWDNDIHYEALGSAALMAKARKSAGIIVAKTNQKAGK